MLSPKLLPLALAFAGTAAAQSSDELYAGTDRWVEAHSTELLAINQAIWSNPELGLQEHESSEVLGEKGMIVAARSLASATIELLGDEELRTSARGDFESRRAAGRIPQSVLPPDQVAPKRIR